MEFVAKRANGLHKVPSLMFARVLNSPLVAINCKLAITSYAILGLLCDFIILCKNLENPENSEKTVKYLVTTIGH